MSQGWIREKLHQLKQTGPNELLSEFHQIHEQHPEAQVVSGNLAYLEKREKQMQYPLFQTQGWPIRSDMVESANRLVVEARLKGSGMHWKDTHVNPIVSLRNMICSDRWKEDWPKIAAQLPLNATQRQRALHQARIEKNILAVRSQPAVTVVDPPEPATSLSIVSDRPKQPNENPWRHFKYGRSLYQPSQPAKN